MAERVGLIGLGIMGKPMARNLVAAGYDVVIHNRSRAAVDLLLGESGSIVMTVSTCPVTSSGESAAM